MKDDHEQSDGALVWSASRALQRTSSGLVRRGLEDLKLSAERKVVKLDTNQRKSSRLVFDDEMYQKVKPLLIASAPDFYEEGMSFVNAMRALLRYLRDVGKLSRQQVFPMKPYIVRFMEEVRASFVAQGNRERPSPLKYSRARGFEPNEEQVELFRDMIRKSNARENLSKLAELANDMMKISEDPGEELIPVSALEERKPSEPENPWTELRRLAEELARPEGLYGPVYLGPASQFD